MNFCQRVFIHKFRVWNTHVYVVIIKPMKSQVQLEHNDDNHAYLPRQHPASDFRINSSHQKIWSEKEEEKEHNGNASPDIECFERK